jgi:Spy/CpxP family protein refolding chaperone
MQQRVDRMATELKLNDEQKAKVTALLKKQAKQRREIVNDTNLSRQEHREKTRALIEEQNSELKTILTPEQFEKWQTLSAQMRTRRSGGPGHSGGPAPAPEPKSPDTKPQ